MIIEGALSVKSAIENGKRVINKILLSEGKKSRDIQYIKHLCHKHNIAFELLSKEAISEIAIGRTHGGVVADVEYRANETIEQLGQGNVLLVEGVEDPYNLGMMLRTCAAAGFKTIITNERDYQDSEAIILKASAGASESLVWLRTDDFVTMLYKLKQKDYQIVSALRSNQSIAYEHHQYHDKTCLCIGGERRGLSKGVIDNSDVLVHITYDTNVKIALSAVSATAVIAFEIVRQRRN
jgi:23S rRNA (guanosine2251-2'-O)-methyltransferase